MQVVTLCGRVPTREWSGTLFYEVTGEFGEPGFAIAAKELYLQDIGSQAYTEYETGDPEFIQFLMQREDLRNMRQGHIHSHNSMGVFFSGTDDDELIENSEFHNYYFSLIVNNKNEMKAKVAFRAEVESETTANVKFRDTNGNQLFKTIKRTENILCVYAHDCDIEIPEIVTTIHQSVDKIEGKRRSSHSSYSRGSSYNSGSLFSDTEPETEMEATNGKKRRGTKEGVLRSSVDFLIRLIAIDPLKQGLLDDVISETVDEIYRGGHSTQAKSAYMKRLSENLPSIYRSSFPDLDRSAEHFGKVMSDCTELLELFKESYPLFTASVTEILDTYSNTIVP